MRIGSFLACAALAPLLTAANQPLRLQPASPWVVDYAENSCRLIRRFGTGNDETLLAFESEAPDEMDMLVIGRPLSTQAEEVPARFLPVQDKPELGRPVTSDSKGRPGVLFGQISFLPEDQVAKMDERKAERAAHPHDRPREITVAEQMQRRSERQAFADRATELEIDARRGRPVILETGSMGNAIRSFDQCGRNSLRDWGVNPEIEDKIVRGVWLQNRNTLITAKDYPRGMLYAGEQSVVKVRVLVDAAGRPGKCASVSYFKLPAFTQLVCEKISRDGRFAPAELADGTKVPSYYTVRINFRIAH